MLSLRRSPRNSKSHSFTIAASLLSFDDVTTLGVNHSSQTPSRALFTFAAREQLGASISRPNPRIRKRSTKMAELSEQDGVRMAVIGCVGIPSLEAEEVY